MRGPTNEYRLRQGYVERARPNAALAAGIDASVIAGYDAELVADTYLRLSRRDLDGRDIAAAFADEYKKTRRAVVYARSHSPEIPITHALPQKTTP